MKPVRKVIRRAQIEFFLPLHDLWEGIIQLPRPPPLDIETMEPIEPPRQAVPALSIFPEPKVHFPAHIPRFLLGSS
jgi:hypothetical protein